MYRLMVLVCSVFGFKFWVYGFQFFTRVDGIYKSISKNKVDNIMVYIGLDIQERILVKTFLYSTFDLVFW